MEHPELESIYKNIVEWIEKNFVKAVLQHDINQKNFKFIKVSRISKVWKESDYWIVDTLIEYELPSLRRKTIIFQVNGEGKIVGFNLRIEPSVTSM